MRTKTLYSKQYVIVFIMAVGSFQTIALLLPSCFAIQNNEAINSMKTAVDCQLSQ